MQKKSYSQIIDYRFIDEFSVLNFKHIAIHVGIENMPDEVQIYVYLYF